MPKRETVGRAPRLPDGLEYTATGEVVLAYATYGSADTSPIERLIADRPVGADTDPLHRALDDFATATFLLDEARSTVDRLARRARAEGATWGQLARRAGITPQSAQQRWSDDGNARHNERRRRRAAQTDGAGDG